MSEASGSGGAGAAPLRVRLDLAYDGTAFSGWAAQPGLRTVQGELSAALATVLRSPEPVRLTVAGRTDAGVHARGQVVHVDLDPTAWALLPGRSDRAPGPSLVSRLGGILPSDVVESAPREVEQGAHGGRPLALLAECREVPQPDE